MSSSSEESTSVKYENPSSDDAQITVVKPTKVKSPEKQKWQDVQEKAFLHWINGYLQMEDQRIENLVDGFRDGVRLIIFLQLLTGEKITQGYTKKPKLRVHMITNVYIALKFLEDQAVEGVTVSADDIVDASDASLKSILGFCWVLLKRFQNIPRKVAGGKDEVNPFENSLLEWIIENTSAHDLGITGFGSLQDGRAFLALLEKYDKNFVQADDFDPDDRAGTIDLALKLAEVHLGIPADILDQKDLIAETASDGTLVLYSTLLYNSFQNKLSMASKDSLVKQIKDLEAEVKFAKEILEEKKKSVKAVSMLQKDTLKELESTQAIKDDLVEEKERKTEEWAIEKKNLLQRKDELTENLTALKEAIEGINDDLATKTEKRKIERDELIEKKKTLEEKLASIKEKRDDIQKGYDEARTERIELENTVATDQETVGGLIANLTKQMNTHVEDMNTWKVFLKQKTTYTAETIQDDARNELAEEDGYEEMFKAFQGKLDAENALMKKMLDEQVVLLSETTKTFNRTANKKTRNIRSDATEEPKKKKKEDAEPEKKEKEHSSRRKAETDDAPEKKKRRKEGDEEPEKKGHSSRRKAEAETDEVPERRKKKAEEAPVEGKSKGKSKRKKNN